MSRSRGSSHRTAIFTVPSRVYHGTATGEVRMEGPPWENVTTLFGDIPAMPKPKILVIEDERPLVEVLTYNLEREGFEVLASYDGQDGLRQAQLKLPDLIVLDLMLPAKPGLEVCRELRMGTRTREIPIVMLTAKAEESDELVGFAMGADDYVTKPYSMKVLIERIKKELRRRQAAEEPAPGSLIESQGVAIDRHGHRALLHDE